MGLTMANRVEGAAREAVDPGDGHHVAGVEDVQHFEKLAAVGAHACYLLAVNLGASRAAKLLKLGVERLAVGPDAGIARNGSFAGEFQSYVTGKPLIASAQEKFPKVLISAKMLASEV
jgi:hypothetical protein